MRIEHLIEDLKQFILATVSQATANMATKDDIANTATKDDIADMATKGDLTRFATKSDIAGLATKSDLARVETKVDTLVETVSDMNLKLETIADAHAESLQNHELRITRLETAT